MCTYKNVQIPAVVNTVKCVEFMLPVTKIIAIDQRLVVDVTTYSPGDVRIHQRKGIALINPSVIFTPRWAHLACNYATCTNFKLPSSRHTPCIIHHLSTHACLAHLCMRDDD